jgi:hypothetical protein
MIKQDHTIDIHQVDLLRLHLGVWRRGEKREIDKNLPPY